MRRLFTCRRCSGRVGRGVQPAAWAAGAIALVYALINFVATIAVLKFLLRGRATGVDAPLGEGS